MAIPITPIAHNLDLSQRPRRSRGEYTLIGGGGIRRVQIIGRGEDMPIATNLSAEGRAQNRR
ncbi:MAG: hypothetical protein R3D81_00805 [Thalassovita sp.]